MNANAVHNVLNVVQVLLAASIAALLATGCVTLPNGVLECSHSWLNPTFLVYAMGAIGLVKSVMNVVRDGFGGLFKEQPPVK